MSTGVSKEEKIFSAALDVELGERAIFLDNACSGDVELRSSIDELLALHDTAGDFLSTPAFGRVDPCNDQRPETTIDRYRLVERIGEGGFGVVWKADQLEPVRRTVALKIIKLGMNTQQIIKSFEAERQALAIMNHANIATVFDAGSTESGRPYFVMELVEGPAIDEYCGQQSLSIRQRLELFAKICRAVHHAHQKGIVHRDIKPANILVITEEGRSMPKIIDFGIAKAMDTPLSEKESGETENAANSEPLQSAETETLAARQKVGTPEYMSPEQIAGDLDIDTRTDVYALGGVLYKLLVGIGPIDTRSFRRKSLDEISRVIREEKPILPSRRLAELSLHSTYQSSVSRDEMKSIRSDLDWITMKALEKDRSHRYESATELALDIERHLACEPVSAVPPSFRYRAGKFVRRHRVSVIAASVVLIAIMVGTITSSIGMFNANRQWHRAEYLRQEADRQHGIALDEAEENQLLASLLEELVEGANPDQGFPLDFSIRQQLDDFADSIGSRLEDHPDVEAKLRQTIGRAYLNLRELKKAGTNLKRALDLRLKLLADDHPLLLESRIDYARFLVSDSRLDEAKKQIESALAQLRRTGPSATMAQALDVSGRIRNAQAYFVDSNRLARESWKVANKVHGAGHSITLELQSRVAVTYLLIGEPDEAERLAREAVDGLSADWPEKQFENIRAKHSLARVLIRRKQLDEARRLIEQVTREDTTQFGSESKYVVEDLLTLVAILRAEEKWIEAEKIARQAVANADRSIAERTIVRAHAYRRLAEIVQKLDRPREAADLWATSLEARRKMVGNNFRVAYELGIRAFLLLELGRWDEAEECYVESVSILRKIPNRSQQLANVLSRLADFLRERGESAKAVVHLRESVAIFENVKLAEFAVNIDYIETLLELGELDKAQLQADDWEALALRNDDATLSCVGQTAQAQILISIGDFESAKRILLDVKRQLSSNKTKSVNERRLLIRVKNVIAQCFIEMGKFEGAEAILLKQAKDDRRETLLIDTRRATKLLVILYESWNMPDQADHWSKRLKR